MSEQLEADSPEVIESDNESEQGQIEETSAISTDQEPEKKPEIPLEAQKIIAEKAFREREARRESETLKQRIAELERQSAPKAPSAPVIPSRWDYDEDADYQKAIDDYANKKADVRAFEVQENQQRQVQQQAQQQQQYDHQQKLNDAVKSYAGRAKDLGVSAEDLQSAGNIVSSYGLRDDVIMAILDDPEGVLITKYLAANPQAIDSLNQSTWANGATVFGKIKESAAQLKPKLSSDAPPPAKLVSGGSIPTDENPWGATIE
jgi:hypothetical protein